MVWYWNQYFYRWGQVDSNPCETSITIHLSGDYLWVSFSWHKGLLNEWFHWYSKSYPTGWFAGFRIWRPEIYFNIPWFR